MRLLVTRTHMSAKPQLLPVWGAALLAVLLVITFNTVPALIAMPYAATLRAAAANTPAAPPPLAFAIVWPLLYTALALAVFLLICYPAPGASAYARWTACGLLLAQLILNWAWTPVYAAGQQSGKTSTAALLVVVMLMVTGAALVLGASVQPVAAALVAPYAAWLVYALVLSGK